MSRKNKRTGFTLIELLVVIAIIAILIALLVPAVQKVRAAAARTQCINNLKQICLASHNYHNSNKLLPSGSDVQGVGVLVYLLPFIDNQPVFNNYQFNPSTYAAFYQDPNNRPPSTGLQTYPPPPNGHPQYGTQPQISVYLCPAAPPPASYTTVMMGFGVGTAGVDYNSALTANSIVYSSCPGCSVLGRSNYLGMGGYYAPSLESIHGIYTWKSQVTMARITLLDGTSNTIAFGEYAGAFLTWAGAGGISDGLAGSSWSNGFLYSGWNTPATNGSQNTSGASYLYFSSDHMNNTCNVAYADGTVRGINPSIDFTVWVNLTCYDDGSVVQIPD